MITHEYQLRPRYGEVDQMGYVYHANYVIYCHQARTELLRTIGISDYFLEQNQVMLPVIHFEIAYKKPALYDEILFIKTCIRELPKIRFNFEFEIRNEKEQLVSIAKSTVVFVNSLTRQPLKTPDFVANAIAQNWNNARS